ncbi:hypothetical protein [Magnetospirillum fulvum]|uniref:Nucleotidyltransferase family protein n=1 Tax=Magnetospirillum fulvum TaxID=1082 RepID=A0A1H6HNA1_MAGFU|nr:hypothetical protein [Magnetospirillum fulvum]SEH35674.1 hypothetical protein SAMN04244559_01822 [Magnetospirillum fulvum]
MTLTPEQVRHTLITVLGRVKQEGGFHSCLIGTAADLLRGVPIKPGDVDFLARTRADVDRFARALAAYRCLTPPTWMPCCVQYYAAFEVDGVQVDISTVESPSQSTFIEAFGSGPWTHFSEIAVGDTRVAVVAPELRLATELCRDRKDQAESIAAWMRDHGYDAPLLRNAMDARGIDAATQSSVMASITG